MRIKAQIPNALTLGNLTCGSLGIILLLNESRPMDSVPIVAVLMLVAMVFDFFDGFAARALKVASPIGLQLDSLADMVTFGLLPGVIAYTILANTEPMALFPESWVEASRQWHLPEPLRRPWALIALLIPVFSGYRLAKFNVDERQGGVFYGLATPANAFFFLSLLLIFRYDSRYDLSLHPAGEDSHWISFLVRPGILTALVVVFSILLVSEFKLIAFKFKHGYGFKENWTKYVFAGTSLILLIIFFYKAVPLVILLYFAFSIVDNYILKK